MASADLDHIRALLIAQTAAPEPEPRRLFGGLLASRRRPPPTPLNLGMNPEPAPKPRFDPSIFADADQELLLEQICGPHPAPLVAEALSPLPPPAARDAFGRRSDQEREAELVLDRPATTARRLQVLDPSGHPIGEMLLHTEAASARITAASPVDDAHAAPYFPEDLMEPPAASPSPWGSAPANEPMRPWIKALRQSGAPKAETPPPSPPKRKNRRKAKAVCAVEPPPPPPIDPPSLGSDLLEALAVSLTREHDALTDRLAAIDLFGPATLRMAAE